MQSMRKVEEREGVGGIARPFFFALYQKRLYVFILVFLFLLFSSLVLSSFFFCFLAF